MVGGCRRKVNQSKNWFKEIIETKMDFGNTIQQKVILKLITYHNSSNLKKIVSLNIITF